MRETEASIGSVQVSLAVAYRGESFELSRGEEYVLKEGQERGTEKHKEIKSCPLSCFDLFLILSTLPVSMQVWGEGNSYVDISACWHRVFGG